MTDGTTRTTRSLRADARASRAVEPAPRTEPKPAPMARVALSERVRAALRCATSAPFVATAARPHAELAEPAPFICG
ncbi:MAG: hypothetical protein FGM39_07900 [Phycisphaerales bacterium]|nr:hypothetical protein [Phycisphaerales bacterium]